MVLVSYYLEHILALIVILCTYSGKMQQKRTHIPDAKTQAFFKRPASTKLKVKDGLQGHVFYSSNHVQWKISNLLIW